MVRVRQRSPQQPTVIILTMPDGLYRFECAVCQVSVSGLTYGFAQMVKKQHRGMSQHLGNLRRATRDRRQAE